MKLLPPFTEIIILLKKQMKLIINFQHLFIAFTTTIKAFSLYLVSSLKVHYGRDCLDLAIVVLSCYMYIDRVLVSTQRYRRKL